MDSLNLDLLLENYKTPIILTLLGLIFLGLGVLGFRYLETSSPGWQKGLVLESQGELSPASLASEGPVVEIAGEVFRPGVYQLNSGDRINDLLILSGGLSGEADRDWVAKDLNLAQKVSDGLKIYVPRRGEQAPKAEGATDLRVININTASEKELDSLWGVGPVTAQKIISGRPYQRVEELLERKILNSSVWVKIGDQLAVY